jgi:peptidoglycan/LPS O-acetylase OafA/YrhL
VFFGLSGLLITKLLLEEFARTRSVSLRGFYIRRAFRILPPAFAYIGVIAIAGLIVTPTEIVSSAFFFRNYLPDSLGGLYTAHLWSLAVEEHFYLLWPGLLVLCGVRRGLVAAAGLSFVFAVWRSLDFHFHLLSRILPQVTSNTRTDLRLDSLFCGCAMAFLLTQPATQDWLRLKFRFPAWLLVLAAFPLCLWFEPFLTNFWIAIIIPLLMVGTVLHPTWRISRILDLPALKWVGRISYSLYLWQQVFLVPSWESKPLGMLQHWPLNLLALTACACASYYLLEQPLVRIGHRLSAKSATKQMDDTRLAVTTG